MKAIARDVDWSCVPPAVRPFVSPTQTCLRAGQLHDVFAVSVYRGVVFLLVVDGAGTPAFLPEWLFGVVDAKVSGDWMCNVALGDDLDLVLGPPFIARDLGAYNGLIDLERTAVEQFWRYVKGGARPPNS